MKFLAHGSNGSTVDVKKRTANSFAYEWQRFSVHLMKWKTISEDTFNSSLRNFLSGNACWKQEAVWAAIPTS